MWGNFIEKGASIAQKAAQAAASIEAKIDSSVGLPGTKKTDTIESSPDLDYDNVFRDDDDDDDDDRLSGDEGGWVSDDNISVDSLDEEDGDVEFEGDHVEQIDSDGVVEDESNFVSAPLEGFPGGESNLVVIKEEISVTDREGEDDEVEENAVPEVEVAGASLVKAAEEDATPLGGDAVEENSEDKVGGQESASEVMDLRNKCDISMEVVNLDNEEITFTETVPGAMEPTLQPTIAIPPSEEKHHPTTPSHQLTPPSQEGDKFTSSLQMEIAQLRSALVQREDQLASKSNQIALLSEQQILEKERLEKKIKDTKEEARKRMSKAKNKVDEMQLRLVESVKRADAMNGGDKDKIITELRQEGESLMRKSGKVEQVLKQVKGEVKDLNERLKEEEELRTTSDQKIVELKEMLEDNKKEFVLAQKGEGRAFELEKEVLMIREEMEKHIGLKLSLEQELKEKVADLKESRAEFQKKEKDMLMMTEHEVEKVKKDRGEIMEDMEVKIRRTEREANRREDALRHEVSELRKRWQDSVRRADALNLDIQQSTSPLLRQIESLQRQNRTRTAAWTELESKLRTDLESYQTQSTGLTQKNNEYSSKIKLIEQSQSNFQKELSQTKSILEATLADKSTLLSKMEETNQENKRKEEEWGLVEQEATESSTRIRNEMMKTVMDSEERYRKQVEDIQKLLDEEKKKRVDLEQQLETMLETIIGNEFSGQREEMKLKDSHEDQASILHSIVGDDDDEVQLNTNPATTGALDVTGSFAAMEQLRQTLQGSRHELDSLRNLLNSSEESRTSLLSDLNKARTAGEKLPFFETKVTELTQELKIKGLEIQGMHEDILETKEMYRAQMDTLLEEQAMNTPLPERKQMDTLLEEKEEEDDDDFCTSCDVVAANFDMSISG